MNRQDDYYQNEAVEKRRDVVKEDLKKFAKKSKRTDLIFKIVFISLGLLAIIGFFAVDRIMKRHTISYTHLQTGVSFLQKGILDRDKSFISRSISEFDMLIASDKQYETPYVYKGIAYYYLYKLDLISMQKKSTKDKGAGLSGDKISKPDRNSLDTGIALLEQSLLLNDKLIEPHYFLAKCYFELEMYDRARDELDKVKALSTKKYASNPAQQAKFVDLSVKADAALSLRSTSADLTADLPDFPDFP